MPRLLDLLRSMPVRLALALVALFTVVSLLSLGATYVITQRSFEQAMRADLRQDMAGFRAAPSALALAQLVEAEAEATDPERMVLSYLAPNRRHFGNAMIARDDDGYHILTGIPDNPQITGVYMSLTTSLHNGQLTIARNLSEIEALGDVFVRVLGLSLIPTILIALSGGLILARRSAARVRTINATLDRLTGGELDARIGPTHGWSNDLSAIGRKVDTMAKAQEASVAAIRQVSSDIAHDLKTPIQRVAVYLNDLSGRSRLDDTGEDLLGKAMTELDGIAGTFHALLQIAQIETGSPKAGFVPVDLSALCATFCELYGPSAQDANHELTYRAPAPEPVFVHGDKGLLGQVLSNLIENAIRHTPSGTQIEIGLSAKDDSIVLSVADTGLGIPHSERDLVLRRLYRMDHSRTSPGAGLGLSLVSSIVALHGADLTLSDNEPGLRVELTFPVLDETAEAAQPE